MFYDKGSYSAGWRYMEAAPSDQSAGIAWSNIASGIGASAQGKTIGTGQANTTAIVGKAGCLSGAGTACDSLILGGYSDWFLPSKDELNAMYGKRAAIGGFAALRYWSSSEDNGDSSYACDQDFSDIPSQFFHYKSTSYHVRAVRAF